MINDLINATLRFVFPFHYQLLDLGITGDFDEADRIARAVKNTGVFWRDFLMAVVNLSNLRMGQVLFDDDYKLFLSKLPAEYNQRQYALTFAETIEEILSGANKTGDKSWIC